MWCGRWHFEPSGVLVPLGGAGRAEARPAAGVRGRRYGPVGTGQAGLALWRGSAEGSLGAEPAGPPVSHHASLCVLGDGATGAGRLSREIAKPEKIAGHGRCVSNGRPRGPGRTPRHPSEATSKIMRFRAVRALFGRQLAVEGAPGRTSTSPPSGKTRHRSGAVHPGRHRAPARRTHAPLCCPSAVPVTARSGPSRRH